MLLTKQAKTMKVVAPIEKAKNGHDKNGHDANSETNVKLVFCCLMCHGEECNVMI